MSVFSANIFAQGLTIKDMTIEHKKNPVGVDALQPRFSWKLDGSARNLVQIAYSIRVATDEKFSSGKIV